jgi:hypothetical protein
MNPYPKHCTYCKYIWIKFRSVSPLHEFERCFPPAYFLPHYISCFDFSKNLLLLILVYYVACSRNLAVCLITFADPLPGSSFLWNFSIGDRARKLYTGNNKGKKIPGNGSASASKNLSILTQKIVSKLLEI